MKLKIENIYKAKSIVITLVILLKSNVGLSQFNETYFYDTITKTNTITGHLYNAFSEGKYMYLSGNYYGSYSGLATLAKIDTAGKTIWTAILHKASIQPYYNSFASVSTTIKSDDVLYAALFAINGRSEIFAVSDSNGSTLWSAFFDDDITKIVSYDKNELLAITDNGVIYSINKNNGSSIRTKQVWSNLSDILVGKNKNVIIAGGDSTINYVDSKLTQILWKGQIAYSVNKWPIAKIVEDNGKYLLLRKNGIHTISSINGSTLWYQEIRPGYIPGIQGADQANPQDYILKDSMIYVTWRSPYVGSVTLQMGYTLTAFNRNTGAVKYNVAHDIIGIPTDSIIYQNILRDDEPDYPKSVCMDANNNFILLVVTMEAVGVALN